MQVVRRASGRSVITSGSAGRPTGGTPDAALAVEVRARRLYAEVLALMARPDQESKDQAAEIMRDRSVYDLHQATAAGRQYTPAVKAAAPDFGEVAMVALAKRGDMAGLEAHFTAHPGSCERYRKMCVEGVLQPIAAERIEPRKETDAQLEARIKRLHGRKDQKDHAELNKLIRDNERAANIWRELVLTGEIVATMPS